MDPSADWCLYTLLAILLAYTHYFGLFTLAPQYVFAAGYLWTVGSPEADGTRLQRLQPVILSASCLAIA